VHLRRPTADGQRVLRGTITAVRDGSIEVTVDGKPMMAPFDDIERAHLIFELPSHPKGGRPKPGKQQKKH
jgi:ribosome maturation factor RimP